MKKIIYSVFLLSSLFSFAQNHYGINVGFGLSKMANPFYPDNSSEHSTEIVKPALLMGFYYESQLNQKLGLGVELNFNQSNSLEEWRVENESQEIKVDIKKKISSIGIPIYLKWDIQKISINPGIRLSINVNGQAETHSNWDGEITNETGNIDIDTFIIGAQMGLNYNLSKKMRIETLFYKDLSNTYKESDFILKTWQLLFGIKYNLK